jgi:hypothetical protein
MPPDIVSPPAPVFSCEVLGEVPTLVLSGCWLAAMGFPVGTPVCVDVTADAIVLRKAEVDHGAHS